MLIFFFSGNMSDIVLTRKPYQLVNFIRSGIKAVTRSVDITLFKWIRYDKIKKRFVAKYMSEPYTDERTIIPYDLMRTSTYLKCTTFAHTYWVMIDYYRKILIRLQILYLLR